MLAILLGAAYGATTSPVNDVSSPYGMIGSHIAGTNWAWAAEVTSRLIGLGWAWAGVAIAAGWLAGTGARGALAAVLTMFAATTAYYGMDSVLRGTPIATFWSELRLWWFGSSVAGPVLGLVGANIRRPGVVGLVAGLTLPVGAVLQTTLVWLNDSSVTPAMSWARIIVWVGAAVGAGALVTRFLLSKPTRRDDVVASGPVGQ